MENEELIRQLWEKATRMSFHNEEELKNYTGNLYHYTTLSGLLGIIQSQKLWGTESSYLNDGSEIKYGLKLLEDILFSFAKDKEPWAHKLVALTIESLKRLHNTEIYISCFCENGDLLSQWKGYSQFGEGFAIGLEANQLSRFKRKHPFVYIDIRKVIYDRETQSSITRQIINTFYTDIKKLISDNPNEADYIIDHASSALATPLEMNLLRFKHQSFKEEHEWRAIYINDERFEPMYTKPSFRATTADIIPYIELDISPSAQKDKWYLPISEIIIGSKINYDKACKSISLLYRNLDTDLPKLVSSKIPLQ